MHANYLLAIILFIATLKNSHSATSTIVKGSGSVLLARHKLPCFRHPGKHGLHIRNHNRMVLLLEEVVSADSGLHDVQEGLLLQ